MGRLFGCYIRILVVCVVFSDFARGMCVPQFIGVGEIAMLVAGRIKAVPDSVRPGPAYSSNNVFPMWRYLPRWR